MEDDQEHCMVYHAEMNYCNGEGDCTCGCKGCDPVAGIDLPHEDDD